MSMLLKSVWRNVLRSTSSYSIRSLSAGIELSHPKPEDRVSTSIKSAQSSAAVLAAVQRHMQQMDHRHMLLALRTLFELQKGTKTKEQRECLVKDPAFMTLCSNFNKHARALDLNEAIEATKVLTFLQVPVDSHILQTMLQLIRCNINFINVRQVIFLDFLLSRFDTKNHLVDALKLALPLVFQIHMPLELDNRDLPLLRDMLSYCCTHDLPDRCINNIVTALLLHDQVIDAKMAKSIIWSLCDVNCTEEVYPTRVQLLHICYDILAHTMDKLTYDEVLRTTAKIKGRILEKHPEYYHEQLMDAAANYVINHDVEFDKGLLVARVLSRIAHTNLTLVEYLCTLAASEPTTLATVKTNILFGFINCLSNTNYIPDPTIWEALRGQISQNPVLDGRNPALPWTKVCLELASLGHFEDRLLQRVFSQEFLQDYLGRENNTLDYLQLLTLYQAVNAFHKEYKLPEEILSKAKSLYPTHHLTDQITEALAKGLGGPEYVTRNIVLPCGFIAGFFHFHHCDPTRVPSVAIMAMSAIHRRYYRAPAYLMARLAFIGVGLDALICLKAGYPIPVTPNMDSKMPIERLNLPNDCIIVCVMNFTQGCFSMNSNRLRGTFRLVVDILEKQGYVAVPVNVTEWTSAPAHERTPYLLREVGYKCGEIGLKLRAL